MSNHERDRGVRKALSMDLMHLPLKDRRFWLAQSLLGAALLVHLGADLVQDQGIIPTPGFVTILALEFGVRQRGVGVAQKIDAISLTHADSKPDTRSLVQTLFPNNEGLINWSSRGWEANAGENVHRVFRMLGLLPSCRSARRAAGQTLH